MWIPTKTYEALPALYVTVGALIVLGAMYIGASHELMPGYMLVGALSMAAGVVVRNIRRNARSQAGIASGQTLNMVMDPASLSSQ